MGDPNDSDDKALAPLGHHVPGTVSKSSGSGLLPAPIATLVSFAAKSSSIYIRAGTFIGGLALDGARVSTLTGLEVSRAVVEGVLSRAGRDVASRSTGPLGKEEAEGLLERSIAALHTTITSASFLASTGFHLSLSTLTSASALSQQLLATMDAILGDTETSRAIAAIITLIRREFKNPETGANGERIGMGDLVVGLSAFALLQRWSKKHTEKVAREQGAEDIVWDVVVLNNGRRADVPGGEEDLADTPRGLEDSSKIKGGLEYIREIRPSSSGSIHGSTALSMTGMDGSDWPETDLRHRIMEQLPEDARVTIDTETVTTKTITIDISGSELPHILPPPGVTIVEESFQPERETEADGPDRNGTVSKLTPHYRVVFKTTHNNQRSASIERPMSSRKEDLITNEGQGDELERDAGDSTPSVFEPFSGTSEPPTIISAQDNDSADYPVTGMEEQYPTAEADTDTTPSKIPVKRTQKAGDLQNNAANQKRQRKPLGPSSQTNMPAKSSVDTKSSSSKGTANAKPNPSDKNEKKGSIRRALKKGASNTSLANLWGKEDSTVSPSGLKDTKSPRPPWGYNRAAAQKEKRTSQLPVPQTRASQTPTPKSLRGSQRDNLNQFSSRDLGQNLDVPRSESRTSFYSIRERRRDSIVSQTDTYSIHSMENGRPGSPTEFRTHRRETSNLSRAKSEKDITVNPSYDNMSQSPRENHRRSKSYVPSIYTLGSNVSETSVVLANKAARSPFSDRAAILSLSRDGSIPGMFPEYHLVRNLTRFCRFSSASYGSHFLRVMGIATSDAGPHHDHDAEHHHEHYSFSGHTGLPPSTILLSSFVDPQGGTNAAGETETGVPLVHYVSLDHGSKAVVLTCRGTLGFEDVLTDMTCDYDELYWRGQAYNVHKGMHASARRLLQGGGGRLMTTIKVALEEFPEYGFVLCGHSLGGGVAAILAILLSEPSPAEIPGSNFVTMSSPWRPYLSLPSGYGEAGISTNRGSVLPPGRPIHAYAYGPPATLSPALRRATSGLITTVVNGQDLVPYLSLGNLRDFQAVALAFKTDTSNAKSHVRSRVWETLTNGLTGTFYGQALGIAGEEDDYWAWSALKSLRSCMQATKLLPPGEVFVVERQPVLQRSAFTARGNDGQGDKYPSLGRPAVRAVLKYVRDVEGCFGEIKFGSSMFADHSPGRYEMSLGALGKGVLDADIC
ncbi:MAG: hypothetical protein M1819_004170 [Sarea resinae]|nr:MAG: hypothetical protein M1819_004170 [Sarea resinae]